MDYHCYNKSGIVKSAVIPNGVACFDGITAGSKANYLCDEGYHLNGNMEQICRTDGDWKGTTPKCELVIGKCA